MLVPLENMILGYMPNHIMVKMLLQNITISYIMYFSIVVSAILINLYSYTFLLISALLIRKNRGPNTVSCATPLSSGESALIPHGSPTQ